MVGDGDRRRCARDSGSRSGPSRKGDPKQPPADPAAVREELKELDHRAARWIKAWTFGMLGFTLLFVVLLLVTAFGMRS